MGERDQVKLSAAVDAQAQFAKALALQQAGRLNEAADLYQAILAIDPGQTDALHLLGLVALQTGSPERAIELISQAIAQNPGFVLAHSNLGAALLAVGRHGDALVALGRALAIQPDLPDALNNRSSALAGLGRLDKALADLDRALALQPAHLDALINKGSVLVRLERFTVAAEHYELAIQTFPNNADLALGYGVALEKSGRLEDALKQMQRATALRPDYAEAYNNLGATLDALERDDEAIAAYQRALALRPGYAEVLNNLGSKLSRLGKTEEARQAYKAAIAANEHNAEAFSGLGNLYQSELRYDEAIAWLNKAISAKRNYAEALLFRGTVYLACQHVDRAREDFDRLIAVQPDHAAAHWNKALTYLLGGDFARGWPLYEWRWKLKGLEDLAERYESQGLWLGQDDIVGKRILLWCEQGFGDAIHFSRYAKMLADRGGHVIFETRPELLGVFEGLTGVSELVAKGEPLPETDFHCPLMSLPLAFGTQLETIPWDGAYLSIDSRRAANWAERLGPKNGMRVGLVWSGSETHPRDKLRSIELATMMANLPDEGIQYFSLQKDVRDKDRASLKSYIVSGRMQHFGHDLRDFCDTAALIAEMDAVVSVDTSVAHLCGALGLPVFMLAAQECDWRWMIGRSDSPWYPSMKIFRQERSLEWETPLSQIASRLTNLRGSTGGGAKVS